ncbi:MAG: AraC family transcriptional regulator [Cyclobacteriaceae bacterium]
MSVHTNPKRVLRKKPIEENKLFAVHLLDSPYFDPNFHSHPEFQLFVVLKGHGTRFVADRVTHFKEGDMVFTGPNVPHMWRSDDSYFDGSDDRSVGMVIYFHENLLGESLLAKDEALKLRHLFHEASRGIEIKGHTNAEVTRLMKQLHETDGFGGIIVLLNILHLISNSQEIEPIGSLWYRNSYSTSDTERMNLVQNFVMEHFREKISLDNVAAIANMKPGSFSRYFKSRANKTFSDFLSEIRISYSCKLLRETNASAVEVCYRSGFNTLSNFNRQFKEINGRTPRQYREEYESFY